MLQAIHDEIISVDDVDGQAERYRRGGAEVTNVRDRMAEHYSLPPLSAPLTLAWLTQRCKGRPMLAGRLTSTAGYHREMFRQR